MARIYNFFPYVLVTLLAYFCKVERLRATHNAEFIIGWQTDLFFCFVTSKQSDSWVVEPFCILTDLQVKRHPRIFSVFLIVNPSYFLLLGNAVRRAPPPLGIPANSIPVDSLDIARARLQSDKTEVIISSVFCSVFHYWDLFNSSKAL